MHEKQTCGHPRGRVISHGGKRRLCLRCGATFTVRPKARGRKAKRSGARLAERILATKPSLRGEAADRGEGRESLRLRFWRSAAAWARRERPAPPFGPRSGPLVLVLDGFWFRLLGVKLVCLVVLARRAAGGPARLRGLFLARGEESEANWEAALAASLTARELAKVRGVTADGAHGLVSLCRRRGWLYQRCHFHAVAKFRAVCSGRMVKGRAVRTRALALAGAILREPDEAESARLASSLRRLSERADCPATVRKVSTGFLASLPRLRTCHAHPEAGLPRTSNAAECVAGFAREIFSRTRGVPTERSLRRWLEIALRIRKTVSAE